MVATAPLPSPPPLYLTTTLHGVGVVLLVVGVVLLGGRGFPPLLLCDSPRPEEVLVEWLRLEVWGVVVTG